VGATPSCFEALLADKSMTNNGKFRRLCFGVKAVYDIECRGEGGVGVRFIELKGSSNTSVNDATSTKSYQFLLMKCKLIDKNSFVIIWYA
jgi:hypothetical protein